MDELDRSRQRLEPAPNHLLVDLVQPGLVALDVELDAPALRGPAEVAVFSHADEGLEVVGGHLMALFGEERDRGLGEKWFGDRQHPVEVENHSSKLGVFHARAIVLSARRELAVHHLEMAQLPPPEFLISAEDTPRGKPDPAGYRLAAERLDALAGECLAIEDSPAGIRAARDAGMFVLGVTKHP